MNTKPLTPDQAIEQACKLAGMTHEQYHNHVLTLGTAHCRRIVADMLGFHQSMKEVADIIVTEITTNHIYGFWAYFQNVCYLRNQRLTDICGQPDAEKHFVLAIWINQLQHDRIKSTPSCGHFTRKVANLVKYILKQKEAAV